MDFLTISQGMQSRLYYTVVNGQAINITMHAFDGEMTDELAQLHKQVIDGIEFTEVTEKSDVGLSKIVTSGIFGGIIAGAVTAIVIIIRKRRTKNA